MRIKAEAIPTTCKVSIQDLQYSTIQLADGRYATIESLSMEEFAHWYLPLLRKVIGQENNEIEKKRRGARLQGRIFLSQNDKRGNISLQLLKYCDQHHNELDIFARFYLVSEMYMQPAFKKCKLQLFVKEETEHGR